MQWFAGFTDAEGNFNISLRNFDVTSSKYNSLMLTFQIGLHIDDLNILESIKKQLNCGHISISGSKCNYFINDQYSLINVILPIFKYVELNSSKYYDYLIFEKVVNLVKNKKHLSVEGKQKVIKYYLEMKSKSPKSRPNCDINITDFWLGGFTDRDGTFSTNKLVPRLKYENHVKELELFLKIQEYLKSGKLIITKPRLDRPGSNATVVLEFNVIYVLKSLIIPLFSRHLFHINLDGGASFPFTGDILEINPISFLESKDFSVLQTKKLKDFCGWSIIVIIVFYGYHRLPEGIAIINELKKRMNNFRLTTNFNAAKLENNISITSKLLNLLTIPAPYEIKDGTASARYLRGTDKLVSEKLGIIVLDENGITTNYVSLSECSKALGFGRTIIKNCLLTGNTHKGYQFNYDI